MSLPQLTLARIFTQWQWHPGAAIVCVLLAVDYLLVVVAARRSGRRWPVGVVASWMAGVAVIAFATESGVETYSDALFWVHMVQHLLLIMIAPLLLLGGRPWEFLPPAWRRGRVVSVLTFPLVGLGLYGAAIAGTHLTNFMNSMMVHPDLHGVESALYVIVGFLFFTPLIGNAPIRWQLSQPMRLMVLVVAMPVDTFTGVILGQEGNYPWPAMAADHPSWGPTLINDLHLGGGIMWVGGDVIMVVLMGIAAVRWARAAGDGESSELGGWLSAARVNSQRSMTGSGDGSVTSAEVAGDAALGDGEDDLAAYNAYLARLNKSR